jgi:hypothetical protein
VCELVEPEQNLTRDFTLKPDTKGLQSVRFLFALHSDTKGERLAILCKKWSPREAQEPDWVRNRDCVPSVRSQPKFSQVEKISLGADF